MKTTRRSTREAQAARLPAGFGLYSIVRGFPRARRTWSVEDEGSGRTIISGFISARGAVDAALKTICSRH